MKRRWNSRAAALLILTCIAALLGACGYEAKDLRDGYYTAEMAEFDEHGWKEFLTIYVSGNRIVTVEYDAKNESGFVKSWDMDYMRVMNETDGTYPNEYVRIYTEALLRLQDPEKIDAVTGATTSHGTFLLLARAAMERARTGDTSVAFVEHSGLSGD